MYRVAIIDDSHDDAAVLAALVRNATSVDEDVSHIVSGSSFEVTIFSEAEDLKQSMQAGYDPDIAFVDVVLDEDQLEGDKTQRLSSSGIDVVEKLFMNGDHVQIIYVSGYDSYHTQVYRTKHAAYVRKPFEAENVNRALFLALSSREHAAQKPLALTSKGAEHIIWPSEIIYLESRSHTVSIHTVRGTFEFYRKLSDLKQDLPQRFAYCHQSYLVNLDAVRSLDSASVTLVNGETIPVSRRMRSQVRDALFAHIKTMRKA